MFLLFLLFYGLLGPLREAQASLDSSNPTPPLLEKKWNVLKETRSPSGHKIIEVFHPEKGSLLLKFKEKGAVFDFFHKEKGLVKGFISPHHPLKFSRSSWFKEKTKENIDTIRETLHEAYAHALSLEPSAPPQRTLPQEGTS